MDRDERGLGCRQSKWGPAGTKTWTASLLRDRNTEDKFVLTASTAVTLAMRCRSSGSQLPKNVTYRMFSAVESEYLFKVIVARGLQNSRPCPRRHKPIVAVGFRN